MLLILIPERTQTRCKMLMHSSSSSSSNSMQLANVPAFGAGPQHAMADTPPFPTNIDDEYNESLRTQSFVDMWSKVHGQRLPRAGSSIRADIDGAGGDVDPMARPLYHIKLPDFLLEPSQASMIAATAGTAASGGGYLPLLLEFFDVTFRACAACATLLASIACARLHHELLCHLLAELSSASRSGDAALHQLASLVAAENPVRPQILADVCSVQSDCSLLAKRLAASRRRILRRHWLLRLAKRAAVAFCCVAAGVAAAAKGRRSWESWVDAAARGAYIVGREMETMGRMVRRTQDEAEHERGVAGMVVRGREGGMAREAAREVEGGAAGGMAEQLVELEEHVYLCLILINRSRKMVAEEIMGADGNVTEQAAASSTAS